MTVEGFEQWDEAVEELKRVTHRVWGELHNPSDAPRLLYHYTSTRGLKGIVSSQKCVWQLISAHFGSLFWPTLRGDGFRLGRKAGLA